MYHSTARIVAMVYSNWQFRIGAKFIFQIYAKNADWQVTINVALYVVTDWNVSRRLEEPETIFRPITVAALGNR